MCAREGVNTMEKTYRCKIRRADGNGDTIVATFDPDIDQSCEVAQESLTAFLNDCVAKFGSLPPVWARRANQREWGKFEGDLRQVDEVLLQFPLGGG